MDKSNSGTQTITAAGLLAPMLHGWKLVVMGVILGGVTGLAFCSVFPPVFESTAEFTFSIDYSRTGLLTDIEEDQALEVAGDLITSTGVFHEVQTRASAAGIPVTETDLQENFIAERRFSQWLLQVRSRDPETAAKLANLWSQVSLEAFQKSSQAALNVDGLHRYALSLETCLQHSTSGMAAQPLCQVSNQAELQTELENTGKDLRNWQAEAGGLFSGLNFAIAREAEIPVSPAQHSRPVLVFAGSLTGLLAASLVTLFGRIKL